MRTSLKYDFCEIEIHDNYIVVVVFEGINLTSDKNDILLNIATKYFKNTNFGYITNRIHSYSVDPSIYIETSKIENLVSFSIVSSKIIHISNTKIEKLFYKKPFKHFFNLEDTIEWTKNIILK
tara:strand:- start:18506 stop:18874 length:369 start_codon:yes stop_codon:yes gene_type:complete